MPGVTDEFIYEHLDLGKDDPKWKKAPAFTIEEIANLMFKSRHHIPDPYNERYEEYQDFVEESDAIEKKKISDHIDLMSTSIASKAFNHNGITPYKDTSLLTREAIDSWFKSQNETCPDIFKPFDIIITEHDHTSKLLEYQSMMIQEFWITNFEPKNPPTNDAIMARLAELDKRFRTKGNKDKPNQLAKYIAMIIRPDNYK